MPWVTSTNAKELASSIEAIQDIGQVQSFEGDLLPALNWASHEAQGEALVIAGSLYLVSDVLRLLREAHK
jgi:folylpolyglutamate synthase